ncbi:MAG: HNH endonuclease, partial [Rouxiella badensis]
ELLVASHIVPWSLCESFERIDPYNGLLLSPNLDKLFDKGLISFTDEGKLLLGTSITDEVLNKLGISKHSQISALKPENLPYLSRHRELFEFKY